MATQTLATADAILKDLYVGPIIEQLNYKTFMLDQIERDSESIDFTGRRAVVPVHVRRNRKRGSIVDGGTLPVPGYQTDMDAIVGIKYHFQGISLTEMTVKQATGNEGSFVNVLDRETKMLAKDMRKDINRQVYGDGTGVLATMSGTPTTTTATVDSTQYLEIDDPIDVRQSNGTLRGSANITAINRTTKVITWDATITTPVSTDTVSIQGNLGLEMDGLRNISGTTGTLHGINRGTAGNEFWQGKRRAASGSVAGEGLFEQLIDDVGAGGNGEVDVIVTTRGIRRRLADTYQSQKRYNDANATKINGGYSAIMVNEVPVISDDDAPKGWAFALNKDAFRWFEVGSPDWLRSQNGQVWHLATSGTGSGRRAAWEAWFTWFAALGCLAPNRLGAIPDAQDDAA
jgi:hypothetical protein